MEFDINKEYILLVPKGAKIEVFEITNPDILEIVDKPLLVDNSKMNMSHGYISSNILSIKL